MSNTFCIAAQKLLPHSEAVRKGKPPEEWINRPFGEWVQALVDAKFNGKRGDLAPKLSIDLTTVSRGIEGGTFGPEPLLRLAALTGVDASWLFRLARKPEWPDLIEPCYGKPRQESMAIQQIVALLKEGRMDMVPRILGILERVSPSELQDGTPLAVNHAEVSGRHRSRTFPKKKAG